MLEDLNEKQKEAVLSTEGAVLVLAGAGSGKTKVITEKIALLIKEKKISPTNVMAITFTNKAAKEMKDRAEKMIGAEIRDMWIGTFHKIAVRILRRDIEKIGYLKNFTIYDRADQLSLVREAVKALEIDKSSFKEAALLSIISREKSAGISPAEFQDLNRSSPAMGKIGLIYEYYENHLHSNNALDFDDLLIKMVELFKKEPEVLEYYGKKFKYIFVDEYQDTNLIQYQFIKLLSSFHNNLTAVGDADQSIYAFRGADISNILNFKKDFKNALVIKLEQNYRSTKNILNAANSVIKNNQERLKKNLWTSKEIGAPVIYKELMDDYEEADFVACEILNLMEEGYSMEDIAILYRTNSQSRIFEEHFMKHHIPYKIFGGLKFYDRKEVKDLISYLKLIVNPRDNAAFKRVVNEPKRGIGDKALEKLSTLSEEYDQSLMEALYNPEVISKFPKKSSDSLLKFCSLMETLSERSLELSMCDFIRELLELSGMLPELRKDGSIEAKSRIENLEEFVSAAVDYEEQNPEGTLDDFVAGLSLMTDGDKTDDAGQKITLMTIHGAKGLEFPAVFVVGMEEGLFPSKMSIDKDEVEEERRLCYVALTRAEKKLFLTSANLRTMYGETRYTSKSRFIEEMEDVISKPEVVFSEKIRKEEQPKKIAKETEKYEAETFSLGDKVLHKQFGEGRIVQIKPKGSDNELVISFDEKGLKKVLQSLAKIKKL